MARNYKAAFGVDVGGTKVAVGLVDLTGRILVEAEEPTDQSEPDAPATQAVALLQHVAERAGMEPHEVAGIGGACLVCRTWETAACGPPTSAAGIGTRSDAG